MVKTVTKAFSEIQEAASKTSPSVRRPDAFGFGEGERQGDIYLLHLGPADVDLESALRRLRDEAAPEESTLKALTGRVGKLTRDRQLAVGNTQGSRHVVRDADGIRVRAPAVGEFALVGPTVTSPGRWTLEHPEHGHFDNPPGAYLVLYQRDYARERAEEVRRVQD